MPVRYSPSGRCELWMFAKPDVLGIGGWKSGFSTFLRALKNRATCRQAAPGGDLASLSGTHQQTCPQSTGITREGVDRMPVAVFFIPVFGVLFGRLPNFFAPFWRLFRVNSALLKKQACPTEPAPNGALATLSWAHQQSCPHYAGITRSWPFWLQKPGFSAAGTS